MKNVTLALDPDIIKKIRARAAMKGLSLNAFIGQLLRDTVEDSPKAQMSRILRGLKRFKGSSKGRNWTREDLYDR